MLITTGIQSADIVLQDNLGGTHEGINHRSRNNASSIGSAMSPSGNILVTATCHLTEQEIQYENDRSDVTRGTLEYETVLLRVNVYNLSSNEGVDASATGSRLCKTEHLIEIRSSDSSSMEYSESRPYEDKSLKILISLDERYMACIIQLSAVVVLDLAPVPVSFDEQFDMPPVSSIFLDKNINREGIKVESRQINFEAINPRVVLDRNSFCDSTPQMVKALSHLGSKMSHSFLVGCDGGYLFLLEWTWRNVKAKKFHIETGDEQSSTISSMDCNKESTLLLVNLNNMICLYRLVLREKENCKKFLKIERVRPICEEKCYQTLKWLGNENIFVAVVNYDVSSPYSDDIVQVWYAMSDGHYRLVSSLTSKNEVIQEYLSGRSAGDNGFCESIPTYLTDIQYHDAYSDSVVFSTVIKPSNVFGKANARALLFACIWDWRSNVVGHIFEPPLGDNYLNAFIGNSFRGVQVFVQDKSLSLRLYNLACLQYDGSRSGCNARDSLPCYITQSTIGYIRTEFSAYSRKSMICDALTLSWREVSIPTHYLNSYGTPNVVSIGERFGRGIALASKYGICILDLCPRENCTVHKNLTPNKLSSIMPECEMSPRIVTGRNIHMTSTEKWKTFSDISKETAFKVHAIKWWEQVGSSTFRRDFVIACVESFHLDNQRGTFKLIGWSREGLELDHRQIMRPYDDQDNEDGIVINLGTKPLFMSLFPNHDSNKQAVLLVVSDSFQYNMYKLQFITVSRKGQDGPSFYVTAKLWLEGKIDNNTVTCRTCFIASCSFKFDLEASTENELKDVATLGLITTYGKLYTMTLRPDRNTMYPVFDLNEDYYIVDFWMDQKVASLDDKFAIWNFIMVDGVQLCWIIPKQFDHEEQGSNEIEGVQIQRTLSFPVPINTGYSGYISCDLHGPLKWFSGVATLDRTKSFIGNTIHEDCIFATFVGQGYAKKSEEVFVGIDKCLIEPPSFVASMLLTIIIAAYENKISIPCWHSKEKIQQIKRILSFYSKNDIVESILRVLLLRIIGYSYECRKDEEVRFISKAMIQILFDIAVDTLKTLGAISLVISTARMLEPSMLDLLFPLTISKDRTVTSEHLARKALDLGSINVASSALPLFSSKKVAYSECINMLYKALKLIPRNVVSLSSVDVAVRQLFAFGLKLNIENKGEDDSTNSSSDKCGMDDSDIVDCSSNFNHYSHSDEYQSQSYSSILDRISNMQSSYMTSKLQNIIRCGFLRAKEDLTEEHIENLINNAASTFIDVSLLDEIDQNSDSIYDDTMEQAYMAKTHCSVVEVLVNYLLSEITLNLDQKKGWERVAIIARSIVGNDANDFVKPNADIASSIMLIADADDFQLFEKHSGRGGSLTGLEMCPAVCKLLTDYMHFIGHHSLDDNESDAIMELIILLASAEKEIRE